jgi:hypothetical protein
MVQRASQCEPQVLRAERRHGGDENLHRWSARSEQNRITLRRVYPLKRPGIGMSLQPRRN